MSEQTSKLFEGLCHCGAPGLYAMHEGLVATGRVAWFCQEHKPDFRSLQYQHAKTKRFGEEGRAAALLWATSPCNGSSRTGDLEIMPE